MRGYRIWGLDFMGVRLGSRFHAPRLESLGLRFGVWVLKFWGQGFGVSVRQEAMQKLESLPQIFLRDPQHK